MSSFERRALTLLDIRTHFHEFSLRLRVGLTQLPLVISVLMALSLVALISPDTFGEGQFRQGWRC